MTIRSSSLLAASMALALTAGAAFAQTAPAAAPAATAAAPSAAPAMKKGAKPRTAQSLACSAKADQQGLHGKPRKSFMKGCKAGKG